MGDVRWLTPPEQSAWRAYVVTWLRLRQRLHRELTDAHDVSLTDYEVLVVLDVQDGGRMRMSDLAHELGSTKSRLSHQVGRMEAEGLVRRVPDPDDKRGVIAELTQAGNALLTDAAPTHVHGVRRHLIDLLTPEEQLVMSAAFTRVLEHLKDLPD
ncbi:MarR family transcriptional regulator [Amycolatopsis acidiphila]|uniref:MarR family transcriptional regulator n=1 Tax=Amycolatopsis acidiphila TaxID=715473 RepID=A0A558AMT8_9PSEU|nr:MarR family transcriptional regulator [Amycolatopsis acidiphila]TVT25565.1 MarR family transcriptional regulator [Amycolatopsis acidiphila]UIJ60313.1 MarR family transcriptional regulator [Amycolatopsis acidiphila]GHG60150.1 MarR family transcriptional regulator [Amycolatopsis acidiphila]